MPRNKIKIVSDENSKSLTFFHKNENGQWNPVSNASALSRSKYTSKSISTSGYDIIFEINSCYNTGNRGVYIQFDGSEEEYKHLQKCVAEHFPNKNIELHHKERKIAVAGKIGSGKSIFIKEMCDYIKGNSYSVKQEGFEKYTTYSAEGDIIWYEIFGIDVEKTGVTSARNTFDSLAEEEFSDFIYCIPTSKIEKTEEDFIAHIGSVYPDIKVLLLLTNYTDSENSSFAEQLSNQFNGVKVIPIMAKSLETEQGVVEAYGIDDVYKYLFYNSIVPVEEYAHDNTESDIFENILDELPEEIPKVIDKMKSDGKYCIEDYSDRAMKIGWLPGGCIPIVHGMCISMITELNKIAGINSAKELASDVFQNILVGVVATPFMAVPLLSAPSASAYISTVGESYLEALINVVISSAEEDLKNVNGVIAQRIKEALKNKKEELKNKK